MLDGLDEAPEADRRRVQLREAIEDFGRTFKRCRILVASRIYAYQKQEWRLPGFAEAVLAPFSQGQIRRFIERWYSHIAPLRGLQADDARGRAELLKRAIFSRDRLRELAGRPLLLTLMASLHAWRGGSLPEKREELYADTVELLLDWWESPKVVKNAQGQAVVLQPSLAEWLALDRQRVRGLLNELAYQAHRSQPELVGTADIAEEKLAGGLLRLSQNPDVKQVRLIEYLSQRAGLLLPRGVGVYTFPHRTFQEYLAACHLTDADYPDRVAELARQEPNRWREVALLAGAKAGRGAAASLWQLAEALCFRQPDQANCEPADAWGALLAGQLLVETANLQPAGERHQSKVELIRGWLARILERGELPAVERAAAGQVLAKLGDPRPGIGLRPDGLPDIVWCEVPAGPFLMGEEKRRVELPGFWISRYPITNAQYQAFVEAGGYQKAEYWGETARAGYWREGQVKRWIYRLEGGDLKTEEEWATAPAEFGHPFHLANHPVVGVTWFEAVAYCHWLTARLRQSGEIGPDQQVRLPAERQWEKAARGTDGREYPWGDRPDPERANYEAAGIGTISAVGCFPGGASPYNCLDLSGNVWEWCRTKYDRPDDDDVEGYTTRVIRGGAYYRDEQSVRCAFRYRIVPFDRNDIRGFRVVVSPILTLASEPSDL